MWPFEKREVRNTGGYEASLLAAFEANANEPATAGATAALEAASSFVARCLAAAEVEGPESRAAAVTAGTLAQIGRSLIRSGESVWSINVDPSGRVRLGVSGHHDVYGSADPSSWRYRVSEYGPQSTRHRVLPAASVLHFRYLSDPIRPWAGVGPLQAARIAGRLSAEVGQALIDEAAGPRGSVVPMATEPKPDRVNTITSTLRTLRGRVALFQSQQQMTPGAAANAPRKDWEPERYGFDAPQSEVDLLQRSFDEVVAACGLSPVLFSGRGADGTAQRESLRRALHTTVAPMARIIAAELSDKLDAPLALDLTQLHAADVQGRARAWRSLVGAEAQMTVDAASRLVGLAQDD